MSGRRGSAAEDTGRLDRVIRAARAHQAGRTRVSVRDLARAYAVSKESIELATVVLRAGRGELLDDVLAGRTTLTAIATALRRPRPSTPGRDPPDVPPS